MEEKYPREVFTLSYDGPAVRDHEMDVEVLANSLLSFKSLMEHTSAALNGRNTAVVVKAKAGFQEGSLEVQMVVEYIGMVLPVLPQAVQTIRELIGLKYFLKGQPPRQVEKTGNGNMNITNSEGSTQIFHGPVYNISGNANINSDLGRAMHPLNCGVDHIKMIVPGEQGTAPQVTIATEDKKDLLIPPAEDLIEESTTRCELEILTPNTDGSPKDWRFYDQENDVTFRASITDSEFLNDVSAGRYSFRSGDSVTVEMITRKTVRQRKRTERSIIKVLSYTRPDSV